MLGDQFFVEAGGGEPLHRFGELVDDSGFGLQLGETDSPATQGTADPVSDRVEATGHFGLAPRSSGVVFGEWQRGRQR